MKTIEQGSLHRFHDDLAIYIGKGETEYLDYGQALKLKKAVDTYINEMQTGVIFQDSKINTIEFK